MLVNKDLKMLESKIEAWKKVKTYPDRYNLKMLKSKPYDF
jgi:hypothetical protein